MILYYLEQCSPPLGKTTEDKEMRKLIEQGIRGGMFERTMIANGRLSEWNSQIMLVDKEGTQPGSEPRLGFNYSHLKEDLPANCMEQASRAHDYLSDPRHKCYLQADLKYGWSDTRLQAD